MSGLEIMESRANVSICVLNFSIYVCSNIVAWFSANTIRCDAACFSSVRRELRIEMTLMIVIETAKSNPKLSDKRALSGNLLSITIPSIAMLYFIYR